MSDNISPIYKGATTPDYSLISAWESNTEGDLTAATGSDTREIGELEDDGTDWDSERYGIDGATVDADNYRYLRAKVGHRHIGKDGAGVRITAASTSDGHIFTVVEDRFRAEGLIVAEWTGSSAEAFRVVGDLFRLSHSIICDGTESSQDGVYAGAHDITMYIWNCVFTNINRTSIHVQGIQDVTIYGYNLSIYKAKITSSGVYPAIGFDNGSRDNSNSVMHLKNCIIHGDDVGGSDHAVHGGGNAGEEGIVNCTNCLVNDTSITNGGDVVNVSGNHESVDMSDEYVDIVSDPVDLHIKTGGEAALGGTDLSGDPDLPFSDDFEFDTRTGTWDIGAHQLSTGATPAAQKVIMVQY